MTSLTRRATLRGLGAVALASAATTAWAADDDFATLCSKGNDALAAFMTNPEWRGVRNVMGGSKAVIIAPEIVAGSFLVGYESGSGVLIARIGDEWSDPAFIRLHRESPHRRDPGENQSGARPDERHSAARTAPDRAADELPPLVEQLLVPGGAGWPDARR